MIKILIAEDEILEQAALRKMIVDKYGTDIEVRVVSNGKDAIDVSYEYRPNIIFMDIHMSICDGLEAAQVIMDDNPNIKIVMITAYDYFSYAREALKIGVRDYILKPINHENFYKTLEDIILEVEAERNYLEQMLSAEDNIKNLKPILKDLVIERIIQDRIDENAFRSLNKILEIEWTSGNILLFDFRRIRHRKSIIGDVIIRSKIIEFLDSYTMEGNPMISSAYGDEKRITAILFHNNAFEDEYAHRVWIIEQAENIRKELSRKLFLDISIGISSFKVHPDEYHEAYIEALYAVYHGKAPINHFADIERRRSFGYPHLLEKKIMEAIFESNETAAIEHYEEFIDYCRAADGSYDLVKQMVLRLMFYIIRKISMEITNFNELYNDALLQSLVKCNDFGVIKYTGIELLKDIHENIKKDSHKGESDIIKQVKQIIENTFNDKHLSLEKLSRECCISQYYLSRLFKSETGINLFDYIQNTRVVKSKEMLLESNKPIKSIALSVGFSDPSYYCKVFKKLTGITPGSFRDLT